MEMLGAKKRTKQIMIRLNPDEFEKVNSQFPKTTCRTIAEYSRKILLGKAVTVFHRNQSLDDCMQELMLLRQDLQSISQHFALAIQKLQTLDTCSQVQGWILFQESQQHRMLEKVDRIQEKIDKISDQWLQ
jgi:hypothetical protein